ncbi:Copia-like polyprotein/retrotransposon, partial [Thalictrum thalictroides]
MLLSWIRATLTQPVLGQVASLSTSREVWHSLEASFASQNQARVLQLRLQLQTIKKGSLTMTEYVDQVRSICDSLAMILLPVSDSDMVLHTLAGLGPDYEPFVTSMTTRQSLPTFVELHAYLLAQESRRAYLNDVTTETTTTTALIARNDHRGNNFTSRNFNNNNGSSNRGRNNNRGNNNYRGRGRNGFSHNNRGGHYNYRSYNGNPSYNSTQVAVEQPSLLGPGPTPYASTRCQLCQLPGHVVIQCPQLIQAQGQQRFNQSLQPADMPQSFAAMNISSTPYDQH